MKNLYIAGKWTSAADEGTSQTINPFDATVLDTLAEATADDVAAAVTADRWPGRARTPGVGPSGLEEYTEAKHIYHNTAPGPARWFSGV